MNELHGTAVADTTTRLLIVAIRQPLGVEMVLRANDLSCAPRTQACYWLIQEHPETFLAQVETETGASLPDFVKAEFDAFLECRIVAHGILRLRCAQCAHEKLAAFSCKRRGFCPSSGARRMAETAAHLIDCVIPRVPVRQWVLSFPIPLRILFAAQRTLTCLPAHRHDHRRRHSIYFKQPDCTRLSHPIRFSR